jgi:hypothetical protein
LTIVKAHARRGTHGVISHRRIVRSKSIPLSKAKMLTLYHGTSSGSFEKIRKEGLKSGNQIGKLNYDELGNPRGNEVFLTSKPAYATLYAEEASRDGEQPMILKMTVPRSMINKEQHEDWYGIPGDSFTVNEINPEKIKVFASGYKEKNVLYQKRKKRDLMGDWD